jgi:2-oxoglutarate ferredoxin oxidoreductase subunit alpha
MQARWGTHGDYASIALSPNSVQEMFDLTIRAFNLAETYRTPVVLLADELIAHMREQIIIPQSDQITIINRKKPKPTDKAFFNGEDVAPMPSVGEGYNVPITGSTHDEYGYRFTADRAIHKQLVENLIGKIRNNSEKIVDYETNDFDNCDVGIVSFGCTSRAVYETVDLAKKKDITVGFVRLKTIWPFPEETVRNIAKNAKVIIVPELNMREVFYEVERVVHGYVPVIPLNKIGGGEMITPEELLAKIVESVKKVD